MDNKLISIIEYGPTREEIKNRDAKRICTFIKINADGSSDFCCSNKAEPYTFIRPFLNYTEKKWIEETMICKNCLKKLESQYFINFENEIPLLLLQKGWCSEDEKKYRTFPLLIDIESKINFQDSDFMDPEKCWWKKFHFVIGIPIYWCKNFILHRTFLKGDQDQGIYNGPDYIFEDVKTKELIGFEIVSYKWNVFTSFRNVEQVEKHAIKNVFNTKSFDEQINEIKKIVSSKSDKKYYKCDKYYLGIVINDTLVDYEYYVAEILLNRYIEEHNGIFDGIFIL